MARRGSKSSYFKNSPWQGKIPAFTESPPFGQGMSLSEKMYARKYVKSESGFSACNLHYAAFAMQGFRKHMQDDYKCAPNYTMGILKEPFASFAVFDGHGDRGHSVAQFCSEMFIKSVSCRKAIRTARHMTTELLTAGIQKTFLKFDQQLREDQPMFGVLPPVQGQVGSSGTVSQLPFQYSGTTVTLVFISDEEIVFANLGDSRTILCRNGQLEYETTDHSPVLEEEAKRIKAAGGKIHTNPNKHTVIIDPDLLGNCDFSISRAIGDFAYKIPTEKQPEEYIVSPVPNIHVVKRDYQGDQFLLLASDGIFKSLSSEQVMTFVLKELQCTSDLTSICQSLVLTAYYSYENMPDDTSVVLIVFPAAPEVNNAMLKQDESNRQKALPEIERELRVLVSNAEDVRILDNEFSIFLELTKKLPPEYKVQLKMDYFRETLDTLRVERYGKQSSKKTLKGAHSDHILPAMAQGEKPNRTESDVKEAGVNSEPEESQITKQDSVPMNGTPGSSENNQERDIQENNL